MAVRAFGRPAIVGSSGPVELRGDRETALLALLTARTGSPVTVHQLLHEIWGDASTSSSAMRVGISRLRDRFVAETGFNPIRTIPGGYLLDLGPADVDVFRFESLSAEALQGLQGARPHEVLKVAERALGIWTGQPYSGVDEIQPVHTHRMALTETRADVELALSISALRMGRLHLARCVLEGAIERQTYREGTWALLAIAYAQERRQAEALRVLRRLRTLLRDELGIFPSPDVQVLESQLLMQDSVEQVGQQFVDTLVRQLTTDASDLDDVMAGVAGSGGHPQCVGRDVEIEWLRAAAGADRRGGCVVIEGEPGVGKSTLLDAALEPSGRPGTVRVACDREPQRPMTPVIEVFEQLARRCTLSPETISPAVIGVLSRLSPDLAGLFGGVRADTPQNRSTMIFDLADALSHSRLDVLIVDDIQWADETTVEVVLRLLASDDSPTVVLSTRPSEGANVQRILSSVSGPDRLVLGGLEDDAVIALATSLEPGLDRDAIVGLGNRVGGNPLFLLNLLAHGWPHIDVLPETVTDTLAARLATLPDLCRTVLDVAALIGMRFGLDLLDTVSPGAERELGPAVAAHIVDIDTRSGHFRHELMREALVDEIPEGRRAELHDRIAAALEAAGGTPQDIAKHRLGAAILDPIAAGRALRSSAESHLEVLDYAQALHDWRDGLEVLDGLIGAEVEVGEILVAVGRAERLASIPGHSRTLLRAAQHAERHQIDEQYVLAVAELCDAGETTSPRTALTQTLPMLDRALPLDVSDDAAASLRLGATMALTVAGQPERARSLYLEGAELARRSGNDQLIEQSLLVAYTGLPDPDDLDRLRDAAADARRMATEFPRLRWTAAHYDLVTGIVTAQRDIVDHALAELREALTLSPEAVRQYGLAAWEAAAAHLGGHLDRAELELNRAAELGELAYPSGWVKANHLSLLLAIRLAQSRGAELAGSLSGLGRSRGGIPAFIAADAYLSLLSGDEDTAASAIHDVLSSGISSIPRDHLWTMTIHFASLVASELRLMPAVGELIEVLQPYSGQMIWNGNACYGPTDRTLARLYEAIHDPTRADHHCQLARESCRRLGMPGC